MLSTFTYLMSANSKSGSTNFATVVNSSPTTPAYLKPGVTYTGGVIDSACISVVAGNNTVVNASGMTKSNNGAMILRSGTYSTVAFLEDTGDDGDFYLELCDVYCPGAVYSNKRTGKRYGNIVTIVKGGYIGNAIIGGVLLRSGSAALGTVRVTLTGCTASNKTHYVAGYAYGDNQALPESPNYTVEKAVLSLVGENTIALTDIYAGAHANQYAYTQVGVTEVNVTGGTYSRIYGGGWAQKGGKSEVGSAIVTVSGGKVEYIYAGGGNSGGETITGGAVITITGSGAVDYVFLGGRYDSSRVTGDVTLTLSGEAKTLIRVSGHNGTGDDLTDGLTSMNVETNVSLGYLDCVEKVVISENKTLNISESLLLEDSGMTVELNLGENGTFDPVENNSWVVMSGNALNETLVNSITFQIGENTLALGSADADGFGLSWDEENKAVKYGKFV